MRFIAGLIALAGLAGLVALIAPLDEVSLLPLLLEHELIKGVLLLAAFGLGLGLGVFAMAKERMSRLHSIATLVGFGAAAFVIEIWQVVKALTDRADLGITPLMMSAAIVLGVVASIAGIIKGRAAD